MKSSLLYRVIQIGAEIIFDCNLSANDWKEMELASETLPVHAGTSHA